MPTPRFDTTYDISVSSEEDLGAVFDALALQRIEPVDEILKMAEVFDIKRHSYPERQKRWAEVRVLVAV